jgi:tetratricopeptide (TPR) repeat protein
MEFTKKGYIAQIAAYLKQKDYEKAYNLAKELVDKFPNEVATHFILSQAAFWVGKYDESAKQGRIAFNKSTSVDDMLACTIITASAYYEAGKIKEGLEILNFMNHKAAEELARKYVKE